LEIVGEATGTSVSIRAMTVGSYDASGITVQATNDCGLSEPRAGSGTITVTGCDCPPAIPTLNIANNRINVGETVTLSCSDVGATSYEWILPEGLTAPSTTTSVNSIVVTGAAEGIYYANDIKVYAYNSYDRSEGVGTGGIIFVETCTLPPSDLYFAALNINCTLGYRFTAYLTTNTKGNTKYEWSVPAGLTIVETSPEGTPHAIIEATAIGNYKGSDIKIKISNDCGSIIGSGSGTITVNAQGTQGADLVGDNGTYTTFNYPMGLGTWMTANSKEGNPTYKQYPGYEEGERGYYYSYKELSMACPQGWSIPTKKALRKVIQFALSLPTGNEAHDSWWSLDNLAGFFRESTPVEWGSTGYILAVDGEVYYYPTSKSVQSTVNRVRSAGVRCIKD
jgi:hypothetical protein